MTQTISLYSFATKVNVPDLLVGFVATFRVTNLCLDVILLLGEEVLQKTTVSREGVLVG